MLVLHSRGYCHPYFTCEVQEVYLGRNKGTANQVDFPQGTKYHVTSEFSSLYHRFYPTTSHALFALYLFALTFLHYYLIINEIHDQGRRSGKSKKTERTKAYFKELLNDVISKYIHHQLVSGLQDFIEDKLAFGWCGTLKFQLNESEVQSKKSNHSILGRLGKYLKTSSIYVIFQF